MFSAEKVNGLNPPPDSAAEMNYLRQLSVVMGWRHGIIGKWVFSMLRLVGEILSQQQTEQHGTS